MLNPLSIKLIWHSPSIYLYAGLYQGIGGHYTKEEVMRAILWAYDLGFTGGRQ